MRGGASGTAQSWCHSAERVPGALVGNFVVLSGNSPRFVIGWRSCGDGAPPSRRSAPRHIVRGCARSARPSSAAHRKPPLIRHHFLRLPAARCLRR